MVGVSFVFQNLKKTDFSVKTLVQKTPFFSEPEWGGGGKNRKSHRKEGGGGPNSPPNWEGRKVLTKSLFEQEVPNIGTQKCSSKRGVREPLHLEFALNNRELVKAEGFEKRLFAQTAPLNEEMRGAFSLNDLLVGTVRPPDKQSKRDWTLSHGRRGVRLGGYTGRRVQ